MAQSTAIGTGPWYRSLNANQWKTLLASNLGWTFDGYETFALILSIGVAMRALLEPSQYPQITTYIGWVLGFTLLGWGCGGLLGGVLADYIGRKRMMIVAILAYSVMTGLSAFAWDWQSFVVLRFLVGVAIGSEWATGASMTAEVWPDHARGKAAGLMQCGLGIGFFLASIAWLFIGSTGPNAWRFMYLIGILPALFTLWIRRGIDESALWERVNEQRRSAVTRQRSGANLAGEEKALTRFTVVDLFADSEIRGRILIVFLMSLTTTLGWWGISTWIPQFVASIAGKSGLAPQQWASYAGMAYTVGSVTGYASFGFLADAFGRKWVTRIYMALALVATIALFSQAQDLSLLLLLTFLNGIFTNGQYSWMPVWLPELFPTRIRATAIAFAFNAPRFIAFLGPLLAGQLIFYFGGFSQTATILSGIYILGLIALNFLPETRGKPLPA
jgi:MFS family permease